MEGSVTGPTCFSILLSQLGLVYPDMIRYTDAALFFFEGENWEQTKLAAGKKNAQNSRLVKEIWYVGEYQQNKSLFILNYENLNQKL